MTTRGVPGAGEGPDKSDTKKSKKSVDSDAFKEMMRVGKVREVDPEEKRKRKQQGEAEEESKAAAVQPPLTPLTPLGEAPPEDDFKLKISALGGGVPATQDEFSEEELDATAASMPPPSESEEAPPMVPAETAQVAPPPFTPDYISEGLLPQDQEVNFTQPQPPPKGKSSKKDQEKAPELLAKTVKKKTVGGAPKETVKKPPLEKETTFPEKRAVFRERLTNAPPQKDQVEEMAENIQGPAAPPVLPGSWEATKETKEEKKVREAAPSTPIIPQPQPTPLMPPLPLPEGTPPPYATLPAQAWDLFERMVGVMTVMTESGISETTINLTGDQFKSSMFYGTQIIIREYTTAPKVFNIEMRVPPQATKPVQQNYNELVAAFQAGNYNFKVNRLDWQVLPAEKEEKRKRVEKIKRTKEEEE